MARYATSRQARKHKKMARVLERRTQPWVPEGPARVAMEERRDAARRVRVRQDQQEGARQ